MAHLGQADRDAVVLRFFENKSLQEVSQALGVEERTAQKRVSRALEKLRRIFAKYGIAAPASIIAGTLSIHSVQAAPAELAVTISAAVKGSAVAASTLTLAKGTIHVMAYTKTKAAAAVTVGLAALLVGGACIHHLVRHHLQSADRKARLEEMDASTAAQLEQAHRAKREAEQREQASRPQN
jgi:hypothetical protein